jgi:hypothetical protein
MTVFGTKISARFNARLSGIRLKAASQGRLSELLQLALIEQFFTQILS